MIFYILNIFLDVSHCVQCGYIGSLSVVGGSCGLMENLLYVFCFTLIGVLPGDLPGCPLPLGQVWTDVKILPGSHFGFCCRIFVLARK